MLKPKYVECENCGKLIDEEEAYYIEDDDGVIEHTYCSERCLDEDYFGYYEDDEDEDDEWE